MVLTNMLRREEFNHSFKFHERLLSLTRINIPNFLKLTKKMKINKLYFTVYRKEIIPLSI